jgi:hypothetical protein
MLIDMQSAMVETVNEAKKLGRVCYLYLMNMGTKPYGISSTYHAEWIFKAYPGGRKQLSIRGTKLAK